MAQPILFKLQQPFEVKGFAPLFPNRVPRGNPVWSPTVSATDWAISNNNFTINRTSTGNGFWAIARTNIGFTTGSFTVRIDALDGGSFPVYIGFDTGGETQNLGHDSNGDSIGYTPAGNVLFANSTVAGSPFATYTVGDLITVTKNAALISFYKNNFLQVTVDTSDPAYAGGPTPIGKIAYPAASNGNGTGTQLTLTTASTGLVVNNGDLSTTLVGLTLSSTGTLNINGSLNKPLGALTLSSTGTLKLSGSLNKTLGVITLSSQGHLNLSGSLNKTLGVLTGSSTGQLLLKGSLAKTLGILTSASTGRLLIKGSINTTLGSLVGTETGQLLIKGNLNATLGSLVLASAGQSSRTGLLTITLSPLSGQSSGYGIKNVTVKTQGTIRTSIQDQLRPKRYIHTSNNRIRI